MADDAAQYTLVMSQDQAELISRACELYCRLRCGQLNELCHELLTPTNTEAYITHRNVTDQLIFSLKRIFFPNLKNSDSYYGVGHDKQADRAFDIHQVLRNTIAQQKPIHHPYAVCYDTPHQYSDLPLPRCEVQP